MTARPASTVAQRRRVCSAMPASGHAYAALFRQSAEPALTRMEIHQRRLEVHRPELRPQAVAEVQLGVGGFPEQEVAQPALTTRADEEIDRRHRRAVIDQRDQALEAVAIDVRAGELRGPEDRVARGVVD